MIITQLSGGLGNQMFQYAIGRRLSLLHGCKLKLDLTNYRLYPERKFELSNFAVSYEVASVSDIALFKPLGKRALIMSLPRRVLNPGRYRIYRERHYHFDPEVLNCGDDMYLEGNWQSYKYFNEIADIIRKDFSLKDPLDSQNADLMESISMSNAISVHFRRGDYVSDAWARDTLGVCDSAYYKSAIDYIVRRVEGPAFYLFSDDPDWVLSHVKWEVPFHVVQHNSSASGWLDMQLMSRCRHHIIANSTFSWWAAWLSPFADKLVLAPNLWFQSKDRDARDLIPSEWTRL